MVRVIVRCRRRSRRVVPIAVRSRCTVSGNAGDTITNVVIASGLDDDGNPVSDDDDAVVTINDVPSAIEVLKTATPDSVDEPGGSVTYSFVVNNLSAVDSVTIDSLTDSIYGDLNGQGDCSVPQTIAAGGSYSCSVTVTVSGNAGDTITNVVTRRVWMMMGTRCRMMTMRW